MAGTIPALFSEPARGTHVTGEPVMILGFDADTEGEPLILGINAEGKIRYYPTDTITFDWRWSPKLGRWADLEELSGEPANEASIDPAVE